MKTVEEIAALLDVTDTYVRRLCRHGYIRAIKHGRDWLILDVTKEALSAFFQAKKEQVKKTRIAKYQKLRVKYVYKARKRKGKEPKAKPRFKYETWEDRSPSQKKWDEEEEKKEES